MELANLALGFILLTLGSAAAVLAAGYWTTSGVTLLSFGLFTALYGVRLLFSTSLLATLIDGSTAGLDLFNASVGYWLPIPGLIFVEQLRGPGWKSSIRWLWWTWIVLALLFTGFDLTVGAGAAASPASILILPTVAIVLAHVVWWRPDHAERDAVTIGLVIFVALSIHDNLAGLGVLPWTFNLEPVGLTIFILLLGTVTARRTFANQREVAMVEYEMKTASAIQSSILPHGTPSVSGLDIAVRYVPMRSVAGDIYDFTVGDTHGVGILVADVTGHGVPAALIASMAETRLRRRPGALASRASCSAA